ncbi:hypothetical protein [Pontibacter pamirensis]|uniref:hypothetical protein n=1 Tax=Pontibacter pamirensis TaxID=2562824 RepID=UPI00138977E9|nr:hypothetical protein [Pontibacter pamirensis]
MAYLLQIQLKSVLVIENGKVENVEGVNGLSATLFYPKSGVPSVETVRTLKLKDKEPLDFSNKSFSDKLLFKQEIEGDTLLQVKLSAVEKVSKFEKVVVKLLGVAAVAAVGAITGVGAVFTAVAKSATGSIFEQADPKDTINIIGEGEMPLTKDTPEGDFVVQLSVPQDITLSQTKVEGDKKITTKIKLDKGFSNAMIVFELKRLDKAEPIA